MLLWFNVYCLRNNIIFISNKMGNKNGAKILKIIYIIKFLNFNIIAGDIMNAECWKVPKSCSPAEARVFGEGEVSLRAYQYVPQGPLVDPPPVLGALYGLGAASYPAHLDTAPSRHAPTPMHCKHPGENTILPANTFIYFYIKLLAYILHS